MRAEVLLRNMNKLCYDNIRYRTEYKKNIKKA